ncbi:MAG: DUF1178 family protein [Desulfobulbales bacterium]|nr:DUF1178 family protein [Desulfobulbales bacterium]
MIIYDLACICGAIFEGWFQDRNDFEKQLHASYIVCPHCHSREIRKILSPTRYQSSSRAGDTSAEGEAKVSVSPADAERALKTLQKFVEENFEDVGTELAREALKIHYRVSEPRNIRGVATESEEKKLLQEGINLLKIHIPAKNGKAN